MTPRGHFTSLARRCRHAARYHDMARLQRYLASSDFIAALNAQEPLVRKIAIRVMAEALADCASAGPVRRPARQIKRIRWDDLTKARFRKVLFASGLRAAAAALGISYEAAHRAAGRHAPDYVVPATGYLRWAA